MGRSSEKWSIMVEMQALPAPDTEFPRPLGMSNA